MRNGKKLRNILLFLCALLLAGSTFTGTVKAEGDRIQDAKNGIVEVYSGYLDEKRNFEEVEHASGFLIYNQDNTAYILTTYNTLYSDKYEDEAVIKVVVGKDVTEEASIFTYSKKENYAILELRTSISEKQALNLGDSAGITTGDKVYALGFPADEDNKLDFLAYDVEIKEGQIQDTASKKETVFYFQHSAKVTADKTGGPLLNEDGYVIGLNDSKITEDVEEVYYALPIDEIKEIMDNYDLQYGSNTKDQKWVQFLELYKEAESLIEDDTYKTKTKMALREAVQSLSQATEADVNEISEAEIDEYIEMLEMSKAGLVLKTRTTLKIIYALAGAAAVLLLWFLKLFIGNRRNKNAVPEKTKKEKVKKVKETPVSVSIPSPSPAVDDGTVILKGSSMPQPQMPRRKVAAIIRVRNGNETNITSDVFYLGKKEGENDYVVDGNGAISRKHACIFWENGYYYLKDLGSANGTFLKGTRIEKGAKTRLSANDRFILADEVFVFRMKE